MIKEGMNETKEMLKRIMERFDEMLGVHENEVDADEKRGEYKDFDVISFDEKFYE